MDHTKNTHIKSKFFKAERLCSKKQIDFLFRSGKSDLSQPIKLMFVHSNTPQDFPIKAMFVVPKKNFRKAHDRNKLKRRMREAYRLNKHLFYASEALLTKNMLLSFIYVSKNPSDYAQIESAILHLKKKLEKSMAAKP